MMTVITVEQMHANIVRIIDMLAAVPDDQRTEAMKHLLENLLKADGQYRIDTKEQS